VDLRRHQALQASKKVRLLDIGCGRGSFSQLLKDHIDVYFGVDPSFTELKRVNSLPRRFLARGIDENSLSTTVFQCTHADHGLSRQPGKYFPDFTFTGCH